MVLVSQTWNMHAGKTGDIMDVVVSQKATLMKEVEKYGHEIGDGQASA